MCNKLVSTFLFERNGCSGKKNTVLSKSVAFTFSKLEMLIPELVIQAYSVDNGEESFLFLTPVPYPKYLSSWMKFHQIPISLYFSLDSTIQGETVLFRAVPQNGRTGGRSHGQNKS